MRIGVAGLGLTLLLVGCRGEQHSTPPLTDAATMPDLDEAAVLAKSHALLEAYDRADQKTFEAQTGRSFMLFEARRIFDVPRLFLRRSL